MRSIKRTPHGPVESSETQQRGGAKTAILDVHKRMGGAEREVRSAIYL